MAVELSVAQVLSFRSRRGHLSGPGAPDVVTAARDILGAQSQQLFPALWALAMRTSGRPTAEEVQVSLFQEPRSLVRSWGQRDTIHLYDAAAHWAAVVAARADWHLSGRRAAMPPDELVAAAAQMAARLAEPVTRSHLVVVLTEEYLAECVAEMGAAFKKHYPNKDPVEQIRRFAAGRLSWTLCRLGDLCVGEKVGNEQAYAARAQWFPDLPWSPLPTAEAARKLTEQYLAVNGPATVSDVAHHFGAKVSVARSWVASVDTVAIDCGGRKGLLARPVDVDDLRSAESDESVRLLPMWDTLLMGHADKSWTVPVEAERKGIWKRAAQISPVVLAGGRAVGIWKHKARKRAVDIAVEPLSGWRREHLRGLEADANAFATHLGRSEVKIQIHEK